METLTDSPSAAARLLHLLSLFSARPRWSATELAERLGVTTRTVRRDVAALRDLGYPIESDAGRTGGYHLGVGGRLPPLLLTDDEAVAVAVGLRTTTVRGLTGYGDAAVSALAKLDQVLPPVLRDRVAALHSSTIVVDRAPGPSVDPDVLLEIARGCRSHQLVRFRYTDGEGATTERRVEPYGLVNAERRWYVVCFDLGRDDWRTFRADRMSDVEVTGHGFVARDEPDTEAMVLHAIASYPYAAQAEVVLDLPFDLARQEVHRSMGTLTPTEDGRRAHLRIGADDHAWIARYLVSLECSFEVVAPDELRDELRRLGDELVARFT
ncbi:helix-turn-helix transcriptional regulator [Actinomarinicola tropica]|uniref:WYL domain-containing protein n=1 Tax=Actinomarinicola tropica TaxID=2789776 RepID=A0A5Q2RGW5_9ACTN|nr:YafY family protein [Actinomarinicola tropica]QGG96069.1 WYL domain-containing protein [Actinomarinicola tropica]